MDNREKTAPDRPESGRRYYTVDELLSKMEPRYREYKNAIRKCIAGLTDHAAQLAAQRREKQLPMFRRMIVEMAAFWGLAEGDTPKAFQEMTERYQDTFDRAVSAARDSGCAPELSEQAKADILAGLELYAREMEDSGDLGQWIDECDMLAARLRTEWEMEAPRQNMPQNNMTRDVETSIGVTVESFLRSHPNATLNILSADGYIYLTPEDGQALLNGGEVSAHPGNPEYAVKVPADMILRQEISSFGPPDADNPNLYAMMINCPEPDECMDQEIGAQGQQFGDM